MSASQSTLPKREQRRRIRAMWVEYILNADGAPEGCEDMWADENAKIARRIGITESASANT